LIFISLYGGFDGGALLLVVGMKERDGGGLVVTIKSSVEGV